MSGAAWSVVYNAVKLSTHDGRRGGHGRSAEVPGQNPLWDAGPMPVGAPRWDFQLFASKVRFAGL